MISHLPTRQKTPSIEPHRPISRHNAPAVRLGANVDVRDAQPQGTLPLAQDSRSRSSAEHLRVWARPSTTAPRSSASVMRASQTPNARGEQQPFPSAITPDHDLLWRPAAGHGYFDASRPPAFEESHAIPLGQMGPLGEPPSESSSPAGRPRWRRQAWRWAIAGTTMGLAAGGVALLVLVQQHRLGHASAPWPQT